MWEKLLWATTSATWALTENDVVMIVNMWFVTDQLGQNDPLCQEKQGQH